MRTSPFAPTLVGLALLGVSCGGSGQTGATGSPAVDASCAGPSPCGGNIVGVWKVGPACIATSTKDLGSVCPGASETVQSTYSGQVTYGADGTYTPVLKVSVTTRAHYPSGCTPGGAPCAEAGATSSATCATDDAGACNCDSAIPPDGVGTPGTYATSGSTVTITPDNTKLPFTDDYCVQGGVLYEYIPLSDGGTVTTGALVLVKQ